MVERTKKDIKVIGLLGNRPGPFLQRLVSSPKLKLITFVLVFSVIGLVAMLFVRAATPTPSVTATDGTIAGCATSVTDTTATSGHAVKFGTPAGCSQTPGASLPISYNLSSLTGAHLFVAATGSDTTGSGTTGAPYATIAKAYSVAVSGDSIIVRGGTYREGGITVTASKSIKIFAYPGEKPIFDGAAVANSGWTTEGSLQYHAYTPQPVTDGSGISFTTGQNLNGSGVGKYPDQAWVGTTQSQQVTAKASVVDGSFWVDTANNRLYMTAADVAKGSVEVSNQDTFIAVSAANTDIEGLTIERFSNTASNYGVVNFMAAADHSIFRNDVVTDSAFITVAYLGNSHINTGSLLQHVTLTSSNWMGVSAMYTEGLTLDAVKITNMNQFDEFSFSPQSGGLKTSRTRDTQVINSDISNNDSQGLWFDQSNENVQVANNTIMNNAGSGVFFEISDNLYLVNNYILATGTARAVKLAGSSGLKLVNNTIVGGSDPLGVYVDVRSIAGCSDPAQALCSGSYSSDRDTVRPLPATMSWIPGIDLMLNNILAYPSSTGFCGTTTDLCITQTNGSANVPINDVIHPANGTLGIPQSLLNGNVYANGSGNIINTGIGNYKTPATFTTAMAGAPVSIGGLEANGRSGDSWVNADGSPAAPLAAVHNQAIAVPTDTTINQYIPAGTHHYGVTFK